MISVLVIMGEFAPLNNCAAIPNTKLIKYLAREDVSLFLITNDIPGELPIDHDLCSAETERIQKIYVSHSRLFKRTVGKTNKTISESGLKQKIKRETNGMKGVVSYLIQRAFFSLRRFDWLRNAKKQANKQFSHGQFDVIYSTYPSRQEHLLAKYILKKGYARKWIADFRDPVFYQVYNPYGKKSAIRYQKAVEKRADHITIVSEDAIDKFLLPGISPQKISVLTNGYDPEVISQAVADKSQGSILRLFYAGSLYGGKRDLRPLLRAVRELIDEGVINSDRIRIEYAGNDASIMQEFAETCEMSDQYMNYGFISHQRVMELMGEVDCSIVCTHNTTVDKGVVTGKVFELLQAEKQIIAIVTGNLPDSELGKIITDCSAGIVYEEANDETDFAAMKDWLHRIYKEKQTTGKVSSCLNRAAREKYSYASISHDLYKLMERIANAD